MKRNRSYGQESDDDNDLDDISLKLNNYRIRNTESNYLRKYYSTNKHKKIPKKTILETEKSYVMENSSGKKAEITKEELDKVKCIKTEKNKLEKKNQRKR